jgi:hypothetical protein
MPSMAWLLRKRLLLTLSYGLAIFWNMSSRGAPVTSWTYLGYTFLISALAHVLCHCFILVNTH